MISHLSNGLINLNVSEKFPLRGENFFFFFSLGSFKNRERG